MQTIVGELYLEDVDKLLADLVNCVVLIELFPFFLAAVAADRAHVDHPRAVLDKRPSLHWDVEIGDVDQTEVDELAQSVFAQMILDALLIGQMTTIEWISLPRLYAITPFSLKAKSALINTTIQ